MSTRVDALYYELELKAEKFKDELGAAQGAAGRFTEFVKAHPVAVAGVLAAGLVAVGARATQMASEVDSAVRQISGSLPEVAQRFEEVKDSVRDMSTEFGVGQVQVARLMKIAAEGGVDSADAMMAMTRAALTAAEALGDMGRAEPLIQGLDSAIDVFKLSANDSERILAKLLVTAQGRGTVEDLTAGFGKLAIQLQEAKVDFDTASAATATLIGRGASAKAAVTELGKVLEEEGAEGLKKLAAESNIASDGLAEMRALADLNGQSLEALQRKLKEQLNAELIALGESILPTAIRAFEALNAIANEFFGGSAKIEMKSAFSSLEGINKVLATYPATSNQAKQALGELNDIIRPLTAGVVDFSDKLKELSTKDLFTLKAGLEASIQSGELTGNALKQIAGTLSTVNVAINDKGGFRALAAQIAEAEAAARKGGGSVDLLTAAQRRAVQASTDLSDQDKRTILTAKALSETMEKQVAGAMKTAGEAAKVLGEKYAGAMKKVQDTLIKSTVTLVDDTEAAMRALRAELEAAGVSAGDVDKALRPMNDQLRLIAVNEQFKLPEILEKAGKALTSMEVAKLRDAQTELSALYRFTLAGTTEHVAVGKQLEAVQKKIFEATKDTLPPLDLTKKAWEGINRQAGEIADRVLPKFPGPLKSSAEHAGEIAGKIATVAQGALGVAQTFGLIDSKASAVLANVINIGSNLGKALGGDPSAIVGVLGSLAGVISGIFGDSAEGRARKQLIKENTAALADLTEEFGNFGSLKSSGLTISKVQEVLGRELGPGGLSRQGTDAFLYGAGGFGTGLPGAPGIFEQLKAFGISMKDILNLADELGIQLKNKETGKFELAGFQDLFKALGLIEFTDFAKTFKGQMDRIKLELETGVLDPTQEFGRLLELAKSQAGSPAIAKALEGLDLTTPGGRTAGIGKLQDLIKNLSSLSAADIGTSQGDFTDLIGRMLDILTAEQAAREAAIQKLQDSIAASQKAIDAANKEARRILFEAGFPDAELEQEKLAKAGRPKGLDEQIELIEKANAAIAEAQKQLDALKGVSLPAPSAGLRADPASPSPPAGVQADPAFPPSTEATNWDVAIKQGFTQIDLLAELVNLNTRLLPLLPPLLPAGFGAGADVTSTRSIVLHSDRIFGDLHFNVQPGMDGRDVFQQLVEVLHSDEGRRAVTRALGEMLEDAELNRGIPTVRR